MPDNNATRHAVQRSTRELVRLDGKLARALSALEAAQTACDEATRARDAAAAELDKVRVALTAPDPEPRRYFTRAELNSARS